MKKFVSLGTECVKFLKAARASQGNFLSCAVSFTCLVFLPLFILFDFPFPFSMLQMLWQWPMLA
jgi:hypothetical protein